MERKTALKGILQGLDKQDPTAVLAACKTLSQQDKHYLPLCQRYQATALRELGRLDELEQLLNGVLAERPLPWAQVALASLLHKRGDLGDGRACDLYEKGLQLFPMMRRCMTAWPPCCWPRAIASAPSSPGRCR